MVKVLTCSSYMPIALLNVDRKLLSKILAMRLENILPKIIGTDQTGFIRGRNSSDNIRHLLNMIYTFKVKSIDGLVLPLDAEKAFDRIEWSYLFFVLDKFGLGENFVQWIRVLYTDACSAVLTNASDLIIFLCIEAPGRVAPCRRFYLRWL